jgi:hypothetical protein
MRACVCVSVIFIVLYCFGMVCIVCLILVYFKFALIVFEVPKMYECIRKYFEQNLIVVTANHIFFSIRQMNPSHVVSLTILENWYGRSARSQAKEIIRIIG